MEQHLLRNTASNVQTLAADKSRQAVTAVNGFVNNKPWVALGIAAAVGTLIGYLFTSRH